MSRLVERGPVSWFFYLVATAAGGCATIRSGPYGVPVDAKNQALPAAAAEPLRVSAGESWSVSSPYFGLVEVTFENDSPAWVQIDRVDLDFGTPDKNRSVLVPWGDEIDVWERAVAVRNAVRATNTQTALEVLAIVGAFGRASARGSGRGHGASALAGIGGALEIGALGSLYAINREQAGEAASDAANFSGAHLLNMPIRVPPGLFTKRWILLYTAERPLGGCIDSVILSYETSSHRHGRVLLNYKDPASQWQAASCYGPPAAMVGGYP